MRICTTRVLLAIEQLEARQLLTKLADLDGDGDQDAYYQNQWFENVDGKGTFIAHPFLDREVEETFAADIDNDGDLDLVTNEPRWYENVDGVFEREHQFPRNPNPFTPNQWKIDDVVGNDGLLDVVALRPNQVETYRNLGGSFEFESINVFAELQIDGVADYDNDGDVDLVSFTFDEVALWRNENGNMQRLLAFVQEKVFDGIGGDITPRVSGAFFFDRTGEGMAREIVVQRFFDGTCFCTQLETVDGAFLGSTHTLASFATFDFEGDGDLDLLFYHDFLVAAATWQINNNGSFARGETVELIEPSMPLSDFGDIDGDGKREFIIPPNAMPNWVPVSPRWISNAPVTTQGYDAIDQLQRAIRGVGYVGHNSFDLDNDNDVDNDDLLSLLDQTEPAIVVGDVNGDGRFNSADLIRLFQSAEYEDGSPVNSTWQDGDFDSDGEFTSSDLIFAFQFGNYEESN